MAVNEPNIEFLLKQAFTAHKLKVKVLEDEINALKSTIADLNNKLKEQTEETNNALEKLQKPGTRSVEIQVNKSHLKNKQNENRSPQRKIRRLPSTQSYPKIPLKNIIDFNGKVEGLDKIHGVQTSPSVSIEKVEQWLKTIEPEVILAPETLEQDIHGCIEEPFTERIIPETEMIHIPVKTEPSFQCTDEMDLHKTINLNNPTTLPPDQTMNSFIEGISEIIVPQALLQRKCPNGSKLSRKRVAFHNESCSPSVFSSPEVQCLDDNKDKITDLYDNSTMSIEKFDQKLPNRQQDETCSEDLLAILAQPSPPKKTREIQELIDNFDKFPESDASNKVNYKYKDGPIRKQSERQKLNAYDCRDCANYFNAMNLNEEEKQKRMRICSRHRATHQPAPDTPENFWDVGFPTTPEAKARGYIRETQVVQFKNRRKRPLTIHN